MASIEEPGFKDLLIRPRAGVGKRRSVFLICVIISLLMMLPLAWLVRSSFMEMGQIFIFPPEWVPNPFRFENYPEAMTVIPFFRYFINTMLILVPSVLGTLVSSSLAAYGFSRLTWPGRDMVFGVLLSTLMLPYIITLLPTFLAWSKVGMIDTYVPLIVPSWLGVHVFYIFLLRQFFKNLPGELDEAATIDGANPLQVFWYIILPVSRPALLVVAILSGLNVWNDFLDPLVYINSSDNYTLALGLSQFTGLYTSQWNLLMAASTVIIVPVLLVFFLTQRYFIEGVTMSGLKG